jgi:hypothetical protein
VAIEGKEDVTGSEQLYISEAVELCFARTLDTPVGNSRDCLFVQALIL